MAHIAARSCPESHGRPWCDVWHPFGQGPGQGHKNPASAEMGGSIAIGVPENGWFIVGNPIKMDDDWGSGNPHLCLRRLRCQPSSANMSHKMHVGFRT